MKPLAAACLAATCLVPLPLTAQTSGPAGTSDAAIGWFDMLAPDMLARLALQGAIMGLRSQMDLQYGGMTVDLRLGQITLTDVQAWPAPEWDTAFECYVEADRLVLRTAGAGQTDRLRLKLQASGLHADGACLPPEMRQPLDMLRLGALRAPRMTVDLDYDVPSAGAGLTVFLDVEDVAAATLTADFSYLWLDASDDPDKPEPVVYLQSAALTIENQGVWEAVRPELPPPFVDVAQGGTVLSAMLGTGLAQMNRDAAEALAEDRGDGTGAAPAEGDPSALGDAQRALIDSVAQAWPAFLENPQRIVLEVGSPDGTDTYLDFALYEHDPRQAFEDLQPLLALAPAPARNTLAAARLGAVLEARQAGAAGDLDPAEVEEVGLALLTGNGAPRDRATAEALLAPLAEAGNGAVALALARALADARPEDAYRHALTAGATDQTGATALLDRLERVLLFPRVLALQDAALGDVQHPVEALDSVALIRAQAQARLSGAGVLRSYPVAALWATLGAAAGDPESADILATIDERVALGGAEATAAWASAEAAAAALAMEVWVEMDLPARFGGQ